MTTFNKNPHAEKRKKLNLKIFNFRLEETLDEKFKHKRFSERFAMANTAFIGMGLIAQFASLSTAFTMLSYLFVGINIIARVACSAALVLMIEAIKRESSNDVMKGIFQYKEVEKFPALLALITVSASIYISVEGAKILPNFLVSDAIETSAILKSPDAINADFAARITDKETERNQYRKNRTWKSRLASKDALVIKQYNEDIKVLQSQKDEALKALNTTNEAAKVSLNTDYKKEVERVKIKRKKLSKQLVITAVTFEVLFLLSLCFSWWYHSECRKEKETGNTLEVTTQSTDKEIVNTSKVPTNTLEVTPKGTDKEAKDTLEVQPKTLEVAGSPRPYKKASFKDYEATEETLEVHKKTLEVQKVKKEFTRVCPTCETPFLHRSANHKYCTRACFLKKRKEDLKTTK